jgi:WD40 repeat protein/tetratricopeptide (TPR) repeat protein
VMSVRYSPDGKRIVSGAGNPNGGETKVWDAATGQEIFTLKGHVGGVNSVAFSPDNLRIVTGSSDNTMKLWDAATGTELLALKGHLDGVTSVAFSPDGRRVVTGGVDTKVKVWDAESGQEVLALKTQGGVRSVAFSRDGDRVATGSDGQSTKVWDARTGREILDMNTGGAAVAFSPDGKRIATGADVRDAETGKQVLSLKGHTGFIRCVAYSPDGKRIATASEDHTAKVWDAESGREIFTLNGHTGRLTSVAFSPDGKRIVTGGDSAAKVWDADKGQEILSLKGHSGPIRCAAFSPDGKRVVTGSLDKTARVWDAETGRQFVVLAGHTNWVNGVAFSSDGKRVATASEDKTVKLWDAYKGQELLTLKGHNHVVFCVAFSPDGKRLVTGSYDQTAKLWNAEKSAESKDAAWPLPDAAERKRYHTEQAALALQQKQWLAAEFHLGRVLREDPENAVARSRLAQIPFVIAFDKKKFALAARLSAEALAKDPKLGDDLQTQPRYHAACAAALAAAGQGMDEPALDDAAKAKLRLQAFDGLMAELTALDKLPESSWPKVKPGDWRRDSDLASVRDPAALAKLPAAEQAQWKKFWTKVAAFSSAGEHFQRGLDLSRQGNFAESVAEYRAAIRRRPDFAEAYCNLGLLLGKQGDYAEALEMRRKGHELGSQRSDWKYPSAQWVAHAERAQALAKRLPAVLQGKDKAADNAEALAFAQIAYDQHQFAAASRLWGDALASDPKLGDDRQTQHRYNAACAAALAAAGQGKDEPPLDDAARLKLRRQALDFLKTELTVWDKLLASGPPQDRSSIVQNLKHWQVDTDLAGIRDKAAMAKLPADERKAFTQLWADVATLLKRAEP